APRDHRARGGRGIGRGGPTRAGRRAARRIADHLGPPRRRRVRAEGRLHHPSGRSGAADPGPRPRGRDHAAVRPQRCQPAGLMADRHVAYALIGGGLAAGNCARWLRESGADGAILLIGRESDLPYNRPPCSKGYMQGKESREDTLFRAAEWYDEQQVEALTRVSAMKLDPSERALTLSNRQTVSFDQALVATGANVKRLNVPGAELEGIHYLRALGNSDTIRDDAAGKRVVLIGGSYIASEVAASLTELGSQCTL